MPLCEFDVMQINVYMAPLIIFLFKKAKLMYTI